MEVTTFSPSAALAPIVEKLTVVESRVEVTRALLPDLGVIVGIRFAGAASMGDQRMPDATITGVQTTARIVRTAAASGMVLAHFRPGGAALCFRIPLHKLLGATVALEDVLDRAQVETLADRIGSARTHAGRAAILDDALLVLARGATSQDPIAAAAVRTIAATHGSVRIADLARELGISQDPLEKRVRRAIGASPKQLATLVRVRYAIALAQIRARRTGDSLDLGRVAHEAGYYDQPHFNREFRAVTGESPVKFFRGGMYC